LLDPSALADVTIEQTRRLLDLDAATLVLHDREDGVLVPLAMRGRDLPLPWRIFHPGQGAIGTAFTTGAPVIASHYDEDLAWPVNPPRPHGAIAVPIRVDASVVGALAGLSTVERAFGDRDVELLGLVAAQVGPALMTMRTLAREQRRTAEATAMATLMREGSEVAGLERRIDRITDFAQRLVGADLAGVVLRDPGAESTAWRGVVGNRTDAWREQTYPEGHPARRTILSEEMRVVEGNGGEPLDPGVFPFFAGERVTVGISIPLVGHRQSIGALCLGWRFPVTLSHGLLDTVVALARFAGTLVAGAAAEVQRAVLINSAPVALIAFDLAGTVTVLEGRGAAQLGFGPEDIGRSLEEIFADDLIHAKRLRYVLETRDGGPPMTVDYRNHVFDVQTHLLPSGAFMVATDVTDRAAAEYELARRAAYDDLTELPNGSEALRRAREALRTDALVAAMADVRAFDHVNETFGYETGDLLLRTLAERLRADLSDVHVVARSGGDEFLVLAVAEADGDDGRALGERLAASLVAPVDVDGTTIYVGCSCGVASEPAGGDAQALTRHADVALQLSRRHDGRLTVHDAEIAGELRHQLLLSAELVTALANEGIDVAYQPIVEIEGGALHSVEALVRWTSPTFGPVPASDAVVLAERSGRMPQLTAYMLDRALRDAAALGVSVCVNVSPAEVPGAELRDVVTQRLERHGVAPAALCLELTETAALEGNLAGEHELEALRTLGVTIAVDDFGQGWSSLELLKRLPADILKLDRAFISGLTSDDRDKTIVRAAVQIAHTLDLTVVAEGIEDAATLQATRALGCRLAQGFHIAKPMSIEALRAWIAER